MLRRFKTNILSVLDASKIKALKAILLHVRELFAIMFGCKCFYWNTPSDFSQPVQPQPYSLPAPIPQWPEGKGFWVLFIYLFVCLFSENKMWVLKFFFGFLV